MKITPAMIFSALFLPILFFGCLEAVYQHKEETDPTHQKTHWEHQSTSNHTLHIKTAIASKNPFNGAGNHIADANKKVFLTERQRLALIADVWFITPYDLKHDDLAKAGFKRMALARK